MPPKKKAITTITILVYIEGNTADYDAERMARLIQAEYPVTILTGIVTETYYYVDGQTRKEGI